MTSPQMMFEFNDAGFDRDNPGVYAAFVAEAEAIRAAQLRRGEDPHYSARTIIHYLRHHSATRDTTSPFKLNDHLSAYFARRLMRERPAEFASFFETRNPQRRSA